MLLAYPEWYTAAEQQAIRDHAVGQLAEADQAHAAYAGSQPLAEPEAG